MVESSVIKQLIERAREVGLPEYRLIRSYLQKRYLEKLESEKLILQGGGALRFFYGSPRLSDDLDFVYEDELGVEEACTAVKRINVEYSLKQKEGLTRIKAYFPFGGAEILLRIELYKVPAYTSMKLTLPETANRILVESPEEIKADKVVALLDLFKRRGIISMIDLYDLCYLDGLTKKLDVELVRKKLDDYSLHLEREDFVDFISGVTESAYRFEPTLSRYLPKSERRGIDERKILSEIPDLFLEVMRGLKL
jgi:predicted nucleotidyltransferase component of viral defense system